MAKMTKICLGNCKVNVKDYHAWQMRRTTTTVDYVHDYGPQ